MGRDSMKKREDGGGTHEGKDRAREKKGGCGVRQKRRWTWAASDRKGKREEKG